MFSKKSLTEMEFLAPVSNIDINSIGRITSEMQARLRREFLMSERDSYDISNMENESHVIDMYSLPHFQASLFSTILEDSLMEMRILDQCNNELRLTKAGLDMTQLLARKYSIQQPVIDDELDGINQRNLGCVEYKVNKLDADRKMMQNTWWSLYLDLSQHRTYTTLATEVNSINDRLHRSIFIKEEEIQNKISRRELIKQLRQHRNHAKTVFYDTDLIVDELRMAVEDAALNAEIRSRYVDSWQRARTEQNVTLIQDKEAAPSQQIEYYKQQLDNEHRVHTEVELLATININETLEKVSSWMNKYDRDIEALDLKMQVMKNNHVVQLQKRLELEATIAEHAGLIKLWVDYKDAREKARLYREKMTDAAVTVQAWWRGLLVRNQLGPYKPQPKRRGAPAAEKGKKKK